MTAHTKRFVATLAAVWLAVTVAAAQAPAVHTGPRLAAPVDVEYGDAINRARDLLRPYLDQVPGIAVAVAKDGRIVWSEGLGWADLEQRVPVRRTTRFRVGSVAKPMTASLLALLYEEGAVDLDAPIQRYVPSFPEKQAPVTTRLLAGHLAGIRHYRGDEMLSSRHYDTVLEGLDIFKDDPLLSEPGSEYSYSSYGWNLISAVIEGATGKNFLELMQERVFDPLGMRDTTADQNRWIVSDRARPYDRSDDGTLYNSPYVDNSYKWAGGGFLSTAEDLVRFGIAHMKPGFLEADTLTLWQTSQKTTDGEETGYGIGWNVSTDDQGRKVVGHGGGSVGGSTRLALYPDQGIVIATIENLSRGPGLPVGEIVESFAAE